MTDPLYDRVSDATEDELSEMFDDLMSKARSHRAMDGHAVMLLDYDEGGNITRTHYVARQRGSYVDPKLSQKYDHSFAVPTDGFLSYRQIQRHFLERWRGDQ